MANPEHLEILRQGVSAWNEWRRTHREEPPILNDAYLVGMDLSGIDLRQANLSDANLSRADLRKSRLEYAYLNNTDLSGANLGGADLRRAFLTSANLKNTIIQDAQLGDANFANAIVGFTIFGNVDLSAANGLELVKHIAPSVIGIDTIYLSKGQIPEIFLRGAGTSDDTISYFRTLHGKPIEFYSCFISYSHKDKVFARRLHDTLQGRGIRCWLDEHQLLPGADFFDEIDRGGIKLWDKVLLCCSEASLTSWWVDDEIKTAFGKEQELMKDRGKRVLALIPLNLDGYLFKWEGSMAQEVKSRMAVDFRGWEHDNSIFEAQFERLVRALRAGDEDRELPPPARL